MQEIANREKKKIRGNIVGDGRIGATSLDKNKGLITNDKLIKDAVNELGGDAR